MSNEIKLWDHQREGIKKALEQDNFALLFEMGCGKTATAINIIRHRCHQNKKLLKVLILAPLAVLENWRVEIIRFSKIDHRNIIVLDQPGKKRREKFLKFVTDEKSMNLSLDKIVITNYESMQMKDFVKAIKDWSPEMLICDESHRLKSHESKRAKVVADIADQTKYKLILTGSPIINNAMDIYMQYRVLDNGLTFGKNFYAFRSQYFEDENAGWASKPNHFPKFSPRPATYKQFNSLIYKKAMRVTKEECLDLPPLVKLEASVTLGEEQQRLYSEMRDEFLTYIKDEEKKGTPRAVVAQLAIVKSLRLLQIVSGFAKAEDGFIHNIKDNPRLTVLKEYLETICKEHKVIIWASFHENYKDIAKVCESLEIEFTEYHGLVSHGDRESNLGKFRKDPNCKVLIANPKAGGEGINLVEASYSIFFSRGFSLKEDLQAESRNHRGGSEIHKKITRIDFIAKNTIDELVADVLANKLDAAETILNMRGKI